MKNFYSMKLITTLITTTTISFSTFANAADHEHMHNHENVNTHEHLHDHGDNPLLTKIMLDQFERREGDNENLIVVDAEAWIGKDLNKLLLKADVEKYAGETEESELQALYSRAVSSYWDLQVGVRRDLEPKRNWGVVGIQGLAPYFFDVDTAFFVGESDRTAVRFSAEYDLLFTQRLILSPDIKINLYGQNDAETMTGSGLSDVSAGLRLRYEIFREFAPYVGLNWNKHFGNTARFLKANAQAVSDTELLFGVRIWF